MHRRPIIGPGLQQLLDDWYSISPRTHQHPGICSWRTITYWSLGGTEYRIGLLFFFVLCAVVGVPLSWHKTCGGDTLVWVGFELLLRSRCVGISARRAEWFVRWAESVASSPTIHMGSFEEVLGRIMFVAGALEHERPFLAPLYKFLTMHPRDSIRRVPPYVSFILKYVSREISLKRHYECGTKISSADCTLRVDAQASDMSHWHRRMVPGT